MTLEGQWGVNVTRKSNTPIKVYCLPEEKDLIKINAENAGMTMSTFLLTIGQGYEAKSIVDYERVRELAKISGDLGRLGGLLKWWLTDDERTANFSRDTILRLLERIDSTQDEMLMAAKRMTSPRAE